MRRSANKLCSETQSERYAKCLLGIKFTELAAQPVSRSEESSNKRQSISRKFVYHGSDFNFVHLVLYTDEEHHNTNTK